MKKTIFGFGLVSVLAIMSSATSAMAHDYGSYNDKVRACKQQQRNGGVVGGFLGAGAGAAAGRALAASKVRPEGVILGTVVGAVIGSQVGKATVECGDLEYSDGGNRRYNDANGNYYGDPRGRSYGEGYVVNGSRPVYDRDGTPDEMYPLGHNDYYDGGMHMAMVVQLHRHSNHMAIIMVGMFHHNIAIMGNNKTMAIIILINLIAASHILRRLWFLKPILAQPMSLRRHILRRLYSFSHNQCLNQCQCLCRFQCLHQVRLFKPHKAHI